MRATLIWTSVAILMTGAPAAAEETDKKDPNKVICKRERTVGSNTSQRVCMTRAQWEASKRNSKDFLDQHNGRQMDPIFVGGG